jgi:hypothetical protein
VFVCAVDAAAERALLELALCVFRHPLQVTPQAGAGPHHTHEHSQTRGTSKHEGSEQSNDCVTARGRPPLASGPPSGPASPYERHVFRHAHPRHPPTPRTTARSTFEPSEEACGWIAARGGEETLSLRSLVAPIARCQGRRSTGRRAMRSMGARTHAHTHMRARAHTTHTHSHTHTHTHIHTYTTYTHAHTDTESREMPPGRVCAASEHCVQRPCARAA